jgi:hypothetical protein
MEKKPSISNALRSQTTQKAAWSLRKFRTLPNLLFLERKSRQKELQFAPLVSIWQLSEDEKVPGNDDGFSERKSITAEKLLPPAQPAR